MGSTLAALVSPIRARLVERIIFNFAIAPEVATRLIGTSWLEPELRDGKAILSFCVLDLEPESVGVIPAPRALRAVHAAHRLAVVDTRDETPGVYVVERLSGSRVTSLATRLGTCRHPFVDARIERGEDGSRVVTVKGLFSATLRPTAIARSPLFESGDEVADFLARGVASWARDARGQLQRVDLEKPRGEYAPLEVVALENGSLPEGAVLDGAWSTTGGTYAWSYVGAA
jgi:hypothetical protein